MPLIAVHHQRRLGGLTTGKRRVQLRESCLQLLRLGPIRDTRELKMVVDSRCFGTSRIHRESEVVDGSDFTMSVTEVSVAGLRRILGPRGAALGGHIVVIHLF